MNKLVMSIILFTFLVSSTNSAWAWALGWKKHSSSSVYAQGGSYGSRHDVGISSAPDVCP